MPNSDMMLRLLTDLKIEHQGLREQVDKLQVRLTDLEEEKAKKETVMTKQKRPSRFPTSFREWRLSSNKE
ncbi:preprotein translocase [Bacillus thuringiensis]|uniref:Preprotein translocase n=1 Tax=Bacillus thuringiensis TaxID=1428 RepID=A0A9X7GJJ3_BACTU|nr:preprotein translocase [Bacillus thuringiensis]PGH84634.1 preprotein translocase [Bacillus thuringiensis]